MYFHVCCQCSTLCKRLSTNTTNIRPLASVCPYMFFQSTFNSKPLSAPFTGIRLLPAMNPHVNNKATALVEPPIADLALNRFFASVYSEMCRKIPRLREVFSTYLADVWTFSCVRPKTNCSLFSLNTLTCNITLYVSLVCQELQNISHTFGTCTAFHRCV